MKTEQWILTRKESLPMTVGHGIQPWRKSWEGKKECNVTLHIHLGVRSLYCPPFTPSTTLTVLWTDLASPQVKNKYRGWSILVFSFSCVLVLTRGVQNPVPVLRASDGVVGDLGGAERFLIIPSIFFWFGKQTLCASAGLGHCKKDGVNPDFSLLSS